MTKTMDRLRELSAKWRERALLRGVHGGFAVGEAFTLRACADELDAILAQPEPEPERAGEVEAAFHKAIVAAGLTMQQQGYVMGAFREALAAKPQGDGARVTEDAEIDAFVADVRAAFFLCPSGLPSPRKWRWIADRVNSIVARRARAQGGEA